MTELLLPNGKTDDTNGYRCAVSELMLKLSVIQWFPLILVSERVNTSELQMLERFCLA